MQAKGCHDSGEGAVNILDGSQVGLDQQVSATALGVVDVHHAGLPARLQLSPEAFQAGLVGFGRKKSVSTQISKHRLAQNAKAEVEESIESIDLYKKDLAALQRERDETIADINNRWGSVVNEISEVSIKPKKTDIYINIFGVAWKPFYIVQSGSETIELPAFGAE